jgi:hypothetical protein
MLKHYFSYLFGNDTDLTEEIGVDAVVDENPDARRAPSEKARRECASTSGYSPMSWSG